MAVHKYLKFCLLNFVFCFLCLALIAFAESKQENHLSDLDDRNDWWNIYQTTQDPFEENRNRWTWKPPPQDERFNYFKRHDNSGIYFAVFFTVLIFVLIAAFCGFVKYFCDVNRRNSRNNNYDRLTPSDLRRNSSSLAGSLPTISRNITSEGHFILEFTNPVSDSNYIVIAADQPPRYDEIVIGDLNAEGRFSEVHTAVPDTPPPQYDDSIPPRY